MTQDKTRRIITAAVSAVTILIVCLLSFLIYQWISIAVKNDKIAKAEEEKAYWAEKVENANSLEEKAEAELESGYLYWEYEILKGNK